MGLSQLLTSAVTSLATRRPRCYLVEAPDGASTRRAIEREVDARGWRLSTSPASADALMIAGALPPDLASASDLLFSQLPGPRSRVVVASPDDAGGALDDVRRHLADNASQRDDARGRDRDAAAAWLDDEHDERADHGDMDHGDMDHGDMEMAPGGIALAEGAEDRDGLEMDVLVHPLGPLLDRWPGGLELRVTLHGDVVAEAEAHWWGAPQGDDGGDDGGDGGWDAVATTLSLAGDERGARAARELRAAYDAGLGRWVRRRVERLGRTAVLPPRVVTTLLALTAPDDEAAAAQVSLVDLVRGHDLADVRLMVASHAPLLAVDHGDLEVEDHA